MGHLKKRSKSSWTLWYYAPDPVTGELKRHTKTVKGPKDEALKVLRRLEVSVDQGLHADDKGKRLTRAARRQREAADIFGSAFPNNGNLMANPKKDS